MSIIDKLKLNQYENMVVLNQPNDYNLFQDVETSLTNQHDAIFIFIKTIEEMIEYTKQVSQADCLLEKGYLFFAYPKKGNKRYDTYIHRDEIFPRMKVGDDGYVEATNLKFSRMVSMDDVFTVVGLKRESNRLNQNTDTSQRVADYEDKVADIEALLAAYPDSLGFFQSFTPGYQKDWARYVFSAKQQKTRENRQAQMIEILDQEYKSIDLFRQKKK